MKTYTEQQFRDLAKGLENNDVKALYESSYIIRNILKGVSPETIFGEENAFYAKSLWRKFMRAYSRILLEDPTKVNSLAANCAFNSMKDGISTGINK